MTERDRLSSKYAEKQRKKRLGTARTYEEFKTSYSDGWTACEKRSEEYHAVLEIKLKEEKKKAEALVEALEYYAKGEHYDGDWENPSGEHQNLLCLNETDVWHWIESGAVAKKALADYRAEGKNIY